MRSLVVIVAGLVLLLGCKSPENVFSSDSQQSQLRDNLDENPSQRIELATDAVFGTVLRVLNESRFVVVEFTLRGMPGIGQELNVYRESFKVAEIRITGPARSTNIAADIIAGQVRVGDVVRSE
jgi:hypothetical protein